MTNLYYSATTPATEHGLARASNLNGITAAIEAAFDKLPSETQLKRGTINFGIDTGIANAYVVALPFPLSSYVDGQEVIVQIANTGDGPSTLNVDGIGPAAIKRYDGTDTVANDLTAAGIVAFRYSTPNWILMSQTGGEGTSAALSAADAAASAVAASGYADNAAISAISAASNAAAIAGYSKSDFGLGNVDNTSDLSKPISTATATALLGKSSTGHTHGIADVTGLQASLDAKALQSSISNIDNTSDLSKPISTATATALSGKSSTGHTHVAADITDLSSSLNGLVNKVTRQIFTASGTYTPSAGMLFCDVEVVGAGAGGGGGLSGYGGAGGGAGAYARSLFAALAIGASQPVTIGAPGAGGTTLPSNGSDGGASSFGTFIVCPGGIGGEKASTGGAFIGSGGAASAGDLRIKGGHGHPGRIIGGMGGDSMLGRGGDVGSPVAAGGAGTGYGSGGAGNSGPTYNGGAGAPGIVIITEYCAV